MWGPKKKGHVTCGNIDQIVFWGSGDGSVDKDIHAYSCLRIRNVTMSQYVCDVGWASDVGRRGAVVLISSTCLSHGHIRRRVRVKYSVCMYVNYKYINRINTMTCGFIRGTYPGTLPFRGQPVRFGSVWGSLSIARGPAVGHRPR